MSVDQFFLSQGVLGAIAVVLASVVVFLYKELKALQAEIKLLQERLVERAEKHAETDSELANKVISTVSTLNELFSANRRSD
jgi:predicted Holliday junction resolvase-like endonuclease